ncbi:keratin-associated protein 13-1-like [Echinops telfairi]|uniref:Keratin-associated protein n=1 Tax=Echinops telfairi TaxID=9371 RepID=A0ABM1VNE1_ECHTE|nr:keratin-associated protein 13-1-like [Echinops telfairi]
MPYNYSSGNFSSRSQGAYLCNRRSHSGSSSPSNLVYSIDFCSPRTRSLGSSLYRDYQESCYKPFSCQSSSAVFRPCQMSCYRPRRSPLCSPHQMTSTGFLDFGSSSCPSLDYGSRCHYTLHRGSSDFRPLWHGFPIQGFGSRFCHPNYLTSRNCHSSCYRPIYGLGFYQPAC